VASHSCASSTPAPPVGWPRSRERSAAAAAAAVSPILTWIVSPCLRHCVHGASIGGGGGGFVLRYRSTLLDAARGSDGVVFCARTLDDTPHAVTSEVAQPVAAEADGDGDGKGGWHVEPDRVICVGGKFAGLWVLRRGHATWEEVVTHTDDDDAGR
jgi:hypothetical protein